VCAAGGFGCSGETDASPRLATHGQSTANGRRPLRVPLTIEEDFGSVLTQGQDLVHKFVLSNPLKTAVRVQRTTAFTPCCSTIGSSAGRISEGGALQVPVVFRTNGRSGPQRIEFEVICSEGLSWRLVLRADLIPDWEVEHDGDGPLQVRAGETGKAKLRVCCRRRGNGGRGEPTSVETVGPLKADFAGPAKFAGDPEAMLTTTREVELILPSSAITGTQSCQLVFRWADPAVGPKSHVVTWQVYPRITISPSALIVSRQDPRSTSCSMTIRSYARPFRLIEVVGPVVGRPDLPADARLEHHVRVTIDADRLSSAGTCEIVFRTDDDIQPDVSFTALALPATKELAR
jgi:hypothetical protein